MPSIHPSIHPTSRQKMPGHRTNPHSTRRLSNHVFPSSAKLSCGGGGGGFHSFRPLTPLPPSSSPLSIYTRLQIRVLHQLPTHNRHCTSKQGGFHLAETVAWGGRRGLGISNSTRLPPGNFWIIFDVVVLSLFDFVFSRAHWREFCVWEEKKEEEEKKKGGGGGRQVSTLSG